MPVEGSAVTSQPKLVQSLNDGSVNGETLLRHSQIHREEPERLQYPRLGSMLLYVVNSLSQDLSDTFASSLHNGETPEQQQFQRHETTVF